MESIEAALNEGLEAQKSPESQMAAHQVRRERQSVLQIEKEREGKRKTERNTELE